MEKLITNLQQTYCTRNSYYMMSIINQFREKAPDLCINYLFITAALRTDDAFILLLELALSPQVPLESPSKQQLGALSYAFKY